MRRRWRHVALAVFVELLITGSVNLAQQGEQTNSSSAGNTAAESETAADGTTTTATKAHHIMQQLMLQADQLTPDSKSELVQQALQLLPQLMQPGPDQSPSLREQLQQLTGSVLQHGAPQQWPDVDAPLQKTHGHQQLDVDTAPQLVRSSYQASGTATAPLQGSHVSEGASHHAALPNYQPPSGPSTEDDDRGPLPSIRDILLDGALGRPTLQAPVGGNDADTDVNTDVGEPLSSHAIARSAMHAADDDGIAIEPYIDQVLVTDVCGVVQRMQVCSHRASAGEVEALENQHAQGLIERLHVLQSHGVVCHDLDVFKTQDGALRVGHPADVKAYRLAHHFSAPQHTHTSAHKGISSHHRSRDNNASMQQQDDGQQQASSTEHAITSAAARQQLDAFFPLLDDVLKSFSDMVQGISSRMASQPGKGMPHLFLEFKGQAFQLHNLVKLSHACQRLGLLQAVTIWCVQAQSQAVLQAVRDQGLPLRATKAFSDRVCASRLKNQQRHAILLSSPHVDGTPSGMWSAQQHTRMRQQNNALMHESLASLPALLGHDGNQHSKPPQYTEPFLPAVPNLQPPQLQLDSAGPQSEPLVSVPQTGQPQMIVAPPQSDELPVTSAAAHTEQQQEDVAVPSMEQLQFATASGLQLEDKEFESRQLQDAEPDFASLWFDNKVLRNTAQQHVSAAQPSVNIQDSDALARLAAEQHAAAEAQLVSLQAGQQPPIDAQQQERQKHKQRRAEWKQPTAVHELQQEDARFYDMFGPSIRAQPLQLFRTIHDTHKPMLVWTLDTADDLAKAVKMGASMVVSNRPVAMKQQLQAWAATCSSGGAQALLDVLSTAQHDHVQWQQQ